MSCPRNQRRCKHALSRLSAAMYMYSAVQQSVANGEDADWDEDTSIDHDEADPSDLIGVIDEEQQALGDLSLLDPTQEIE